MHRSLAPFAVATAFVCLSSCGEPQTPVPAVRTRAEHKAVPEQEAAAQQVGRPVVETNSIGMRFVLIPPGVYWRGSSATDGYRLEDEGPQHRVRITRPYYLGTHEVTCGQFRQFVEARAYVTEAERDGQGGFGFDGKAFVAKPEFTWRDVGFPQTDEHPVVNVSWNDAVAFCQWLAQKESRMYRLPTEAEWEYACRAGSRTRYSYGYDDDGMTDHAWIEVNSSGTTHPVGEKRPNAWGLYDMHGNVYEWCADCYCPYAESSTPVDDPTGPADGVYFAYRGGCWYTPASQCRSALRLRSQTRNRSGSLGFRVACYLDSSPAPLPSDLTSKPPTQ